MKIQEAGEPSGDSASASRSPRRERRRTLDRTIVAAICVLMDQIGQAIVLVSPSGRLLFVNRCARTLSEPPNPLFRIHRQQLTIAGQPVHAWVNELGARESVHHFASPRKSHSRTQQAREYRVMVTRLGLRRVSDPIAIRIYEPAEDRQLSPDVLHELYRLTHAESDITVRLFAGQTLNGIAKERRISIHTVRSQVKRVFQKCQVNSQVELARFLACGPGVM